MRLLLLLIFIPLYIYPQVQIPVDTTFALYSEYQKQKEHYPFIEIALPEIAPGVVVKKDIVYAESGGRKLHIDLFLPQSEGNKSPVVLLIHGGGWRSGNRKMEHPMAARLASNGYAAAAVEYRLSGEAKYPAAVNDLFLAVSWLKNNFQKYNLDPGKIAVYGTSAGGTLAALLGTTGASGKYTSGKEPIPVQAIIDVDGILDFTDPAESGKDTNETKPSAGKLWFGHSYKEKPELWIAASPLIYAGNGTPPVLFVNSSLDRFHAGRDQFIEKIKPYNTYYEVHTIQNTPHPFWLFHPWFNETSGYVINFLDKIFK